MGRGSTARALGLLALAGCNEQGFTQLTKVDVFQQNRLNTVDVLLVVDNSCSMVEEQDKLATNFAGFIQYFEDADVDWQIGVVTTDVFDEDQSGRLQGGDDEIVLKDATGTEVDRVAYDRDWPVAPGTVFSLDPSWANGAGNDVASHWCTSAEGTPGAENPGCGGAGNGPTQRDSLLITEFLPDPDGVADETAEWVEIGNVGAETVDLTGYTLVDDGRNAWTFPDGASIAPGESLVLARTLDVQEADYALGADFTLNDRTFLLTGETQGAAEIFSEMVAQGTTGTGLERGLEAARLALTPDLLAGDNAGLVREDANLSILVVSDEEDSSPLPVHEYLRAFADAKGEAAYRDHTLMNVSGVVGEEAPEFDGEPSCQSSHGFADYGARYVAAASETEGLLESICDEDFSPIVERLGLTLSGLQAEWTLSQRPDLDSLLVSLYATHENDSKIRDLTRDVDYTYVEETNSIRFEYDQVPESQQYVVVEYEVRSGG